MKKLTLLFTAILTVFLFTSPVYAAADIRLSSRCTLADAIIAANSDRVEGDCPAGRGADTITLTRDITLDGGLPKITSDIIIEGNGYTISGDNRWRIFYNEGGALTIHDLTMTKGRIEGVLISNADGTLKSTTANPIGGAIVNRAGTLAITNSAFSSNSAGAGGAIYNNGELSISDSAFSHNSAEYGGAIYNSNGTLTINDSSFNGNSADSAGGAILHREGTLGITNSAFSDNSAGLSWGGAIENRGLLHIHSSAFSGNSAGLWGGAIFNHGGTLTISDSAFSDNSAEGGGAIENGGWLSIVNSAFSGNSADYWGGAIRNVGEVRIRSSSFSHNSSDKGGAIYSWEIGRLRIINSIIAGIGGDACYSDNRLKQNISNFIQDGSCSPAFEGDPKLGELVEPEDGSPAYFPLLEGSRAIDAADDDYCPETDQIGTDRPQGAGCDIGAFEYITES